MASQVAKKPQSQAVEGKPKLKLRDFKEKLNSREFIANLSLPLIKSVPLEPGEVFDPKTVLKAFEGANDELKSLRKNCQRTIEDLEDAAQASDANRKQKLTELNDAFEQVFKAFHVLESEIAEVGETAVRIGGQLETIDRQRNRASDTKDLIQFFLEFSIDRSVKLDELFAIGQEGEYKTAVIMRKLSTIAKEVDNPGTEVARANIEKYCESFEKKMLAAFDDAYRKGNVQIMKHCAKTLWDFNGGQSCVQAYVNQHYYFINQMKSAENESQSPTKGSISREDPDFAKNYTPDPSLLKMRSEVIDVCKREWDIIYAVFPDAIHVMQVFLQRIFAQSVQITIEKTLSKAQLISNREYLRTLAASHAITIQLVEELKKFDATVIGNRYGRPALMDTLDRAVNDLFVQFSEGDRYINLEIKDTRDRFENILSGFNNVLSFKKAQKKKKKPVPVNPNPSSQQNPIMYTNSSVNDSTLPNTDFLSIFSTETIVKMLLSHSETIKRCAELSPDGGIADNVSILFKMLLNHVGPSYVNPSLDLALEETPVDGKLDLDFRTLAVIPIADQIARLIQIHFQETVLPLISPIPAVHRELTMLKGDFINLIETKISDILQNYIEASISRLSTLLHTQKKVDFRPKDESVGLLTPCTLTCTNITEFLAKVFDAISKCLEGPNLESFWTEIGISFHGMLLEHYKKFVVGNNGGHLLMKDLTKYQEAILKLKIPSLEERYEMLRELGGIFVVRGTSVELKNVVTQGYLSRIEPSLLLPYLQMRADWTHLPKAEREKFSGSNAQSSTHSNSTIMKDEINVSDIKRK